MKHVSWLSVGLWSSCASTASRWSGSQGPTMTQRWRSYLHPLPDDLRDRYLCWNIRIIGNSTQYIFITSTFERKYKKGIIPVSSSMPPNRLLLCWRLLGPTREMQIHCGGAPSDSQMLLRSSLRMLRASHVNTSDEQSITWAPNSILERFIRLKKYSFLA